MTGKPDFRPQFSELTFPTMELTYSAWPGQRGLSNRIPTRPRREDELGPLHSVTLAFGEISTSGEWWTVESTAAVTRGTGRKATQGRVSTYDGPPGERSLAVLGSAAWFVHELWIRCPHDRVSGMPDDPWAIQDETDLKSMPLPVDETLVEFIAASARGLSAAAADLARCTITIGGIGDLDRLALQTVRDPTPYVPRPT
jgi:hypothetical protein